MKKELLRIIKENCEQKNFEENTSSALSEHLQISRNEVALMLRELHSKGILAKIEQKPLLYLDIETMKQAGYAMDQTSYPDLSALLEQESEKADFEKLIGYQGSLGELVKQCKATISYPPKGLPMILYGETGTGKSMIAKLTYEYARNHGLLQPGGKFISVNCSEYANNPELLTANLFGHVKGAFTGADKDNPGLMALADGGVLFLDEVHNLKAECQEKLFLFMDQSIYHRVGDNEKWYEANVRIIFATTEDPEKVLLKTLQRRIPMVFTVPNLEDRGMEERVQLLYTMFQAEKKRLKKNIRISSKVYNILLTHNFDGNIGGLKSCVQSCCVKSLFDTDEKGELLVRLQSLPEHMLNDYANKHKNVISSVDTEYIEVDELAKFIHKEKPIICLNEDMRKTFLSYEEHSIGVEVCFDQLQTHLQHYFDHVFFKNYDIKDKDFYQKGVESIFDLVSNRYGLKISNNDLLSISLYLHDYQKNFHSYHNWTMQNKEFCNRFHSFMKEEFYHEFHVAEEICNYLHSYMDMEIMSMVSIILVLFIKNLSSSKEQRHVIAVILAHGFSTASSIADATNKFLGSYIFDAIDMPLNVDTNTILEKLNLFLSRTGIYEELYLLVDMGSLEDIYKGIHVENANIGIINNISTKAALEIGNGIVQNRPMEEIFQNVISYSNTMYHIEKHRDQEKVILCSCASGIGTAEKLRTIIQDSLPADSGIAVKTYHYNELVEKGSNNTFFDSYHVLCVIGTLNPNIDGLNYVPIEDLIISDNLIELDQYMKDSLTAMELEEFRKNIVKNFSLSNIMSNLTILNPNKLLEHVADAIDRLQKGMDMKFSNATCFGLYVHISCLVERLVMKKGIEKYQDIDAFAKKEEKFISLVKQTCKEVEEFYGIDIPVAEIGYIYDYIRNDHDF